MLVLASAREGWDSNPTSHYEIHIAYFKNLTDMLISSCRVPLIVDAEMMCEKKKCPDTFVIKGVLPYMEHLRP